MGSHGSEFDVGISIDIDEAARDRLADISRELDELAQHHDGIGLEVKPASVALHYRTAGSRDGFGRGRRRAEGPGDARRRLRQTRQDGRRACGRARDKGESLVAYAKSSAPPPSCTSAMMSPTKTRLPRLSGPDLGIKVGEGTTHASLRLADTEQVSHVLAQLYEARRDWVLGTGALPIERHSLLSNGKHTAIVNPRGRIVWLCFPRPDSPALFAELVGGEPAGYFDVASARNAAPLAQRYLGDSMIVQTRWPGFTVHDYFDDPPGEREDQNAPLRLLRCVSGSEVARITFAPRPDYSMGPVSMTIERDDQQNGRSVWSPPGSSLPISLRAPGIEWTFREDGVHTTATAEVDLRNGPVCPRVALRHPRSRRTTTTPRHAPATREGCLERLGRRACVCPPSRPTRLAVARSR